MAYCPNDSNLAMRCWQCREHDRPRKQLKQSLSHPCPTTEATISIPEDIQSPRLWSSMKRNWSMKEGLPTALLTLGSRELLLELNPTAIRNLLFSELPVFLLRSSIRLIHRNTRYDWNRDILS